MFVGLADECGRLGQHLMLIFRAQVDRVTDSHHVESIVDQRQSVIDVPHRRLRGSLWEVFTRLVLEFSLTRYGRSG